MESNEITRIRMVYAERERTRSLDKRNRGRERLLCERNDALDRLLSERFGRPLPRCRILDVGCGYGSLLRWFHERDVPSEHLFGIDLLPNRIRIARETYPAFTFVQGSADQLPFPDRSFDLVLVFTVFSSILDGELAGSVARSIGRVLKSQGAIVWYDIRYPNPWNPSVRAMTKPRIRELFPAFQFECRPLTLLPILAYRLGSLTDRTYPLLASLNILRSHYLGLLRPARDDLIRRTDLVAGL
jgi:SAM-dependent methyltransferase